MSSDNGGIPPQGQQPPAYPGAPVPPSQSAYPGAPVMPNQPAYQAAVPNQPAAPAYPGATTPVQGYPGAAPTAPGYTASPYAQPYGAPYPAPPRSNGLAITSLICGIVGLVLIPFFASVVAVITGHMGLNQIKRDPGVGGKGLAITGLVLGYVGVVFGLLIGAMILIGILAAASQGYSSY